MNLKSQRTSCHSLGLLRSRLDVEVGLANLRLLGLGIYSSKVKCQIFKSDNNNY